MVIILPVSVDYKAQRYPVVTFTVIGLNVLVYLLLLLVGWSGGERAQLRLLFTLGLIPAAPTWHGLITTLFTHLGFFHLLGNMIYLFLFGACVEDVIGRWQFAAFYLLGGLASDFLHILFSSGQLMAMVPVVGASGAVSACIGGFLLLLAKTKINFRYFVFLVVRVLSGDFWLPAWLVISFWFIKDLLFAVLSLANEAVGGGVAFAAHVGGSLGGLGMIGLYRAFQRGRDWGGPVRQVMPATGPRIVRRSAEPTTYLYEEGRQSGPFTVQQVKAMLACEAIGATALYWREGMADWRSVQELSAAPQ
jgi:membrane associated rhomboid family serine protease